MTFYLQHLCVPFIFLTTEPGFHPVLQLLINDTP